MFGSISITLKVAVEISVCNVSSLSSPTIAVDIVDEPDVTAIKIEVDVELKY